jgi:hypothetical protein
MAWALVLAALTANARGTWDGVSDGLPAPATGEIVGSFWPELLLTAGRGVLLVVVAASFGFAIAMLVRNTGASLGVAFVYFAVGELAQQRVFLRFGIMEWMLSSNASAFLIPGGIEVVSGTETVREGGGSYEAQSYSHLSNLRGFSTLLLYLAAVAVPASWSFTRRDVS